MNTQRPTPVLTCQHKQKCVCVSSIHSNFSSTSKSNSKSAAHWMTSCQSAVHLLFDHSAFRMHPDNFRILCLAVTPLQTQCRPLDDKGASGVLGCRNFFDCIARHQRKLSSLFTIEPTFRVPRGPLAIQSFTGV